MRNAAFSNKLYLVGEEGLEPPWAVPQASHEKHSFSGGTALRTVADSAHLTSVKLLKILGEASARADRLACKVFSGAAGRT